MGKHSHCACVYVCASSWPRVCTTDGRRDAPHLTTPASRPRPRPTSTIHPPHAHPTTPLTPSHHHQYAHRAGPDGLCQRARVAVPCARVDQPPPLTRPHTHQTFPAHSQITHPAPSSAATATPPTTPPSYRRCHRRAHRQLPTLPCTDFANYRTTPAVTARSRPHSRSPRADFNASAYITGDASCPPCGYDRNARARQARDGETHGAPVSGCTDTSATRDDKIKRDVIHTSRNVER